MVTLVTWCLVKLVRSMGSTKGTMSWPKAFAWGFGITAAAFVFMAVIILLESAFKWLGVGIFAFVVLTFVIAIVAKSTR
jgi:hypothetical protein